MARSSTALRRTPLVPVVVLVAVLGACAVRHGPVEDARPEQVSAATTSTALTSSGGAHPDADSTGVPAGTQLRPSDSITVTQDGAVIEDLEVTGRIIVDAQNVTIRRVLVYATGSQGIYVRNGSATIEDVDVVGRNECAVGIGYGNYTARRVDIRGCQDGAKIGNNTVLVDSYIHDLLKIAGSHNDGIQCTGNCKNVRILHNTIRGPHQASTASVKFSTNTGPITDVLIKDNYLAGGNYTIYFDDKNKGYGPATHFHVVDNVIEANSYKWGWRTGDHHHTQTWSNNVIR